MRETLLGFCNRIKDIDLHFRLFSVDARELPAHLSADEYQFGRIEVNSINLTSKHFLNSNTTTGLQHLRSRIRRTRKDSLHLQPAPQTKDRQSTSNTANALFERHRRGILARRRPKPPKTLQGVSITYAKVRTVHAYDTHVHDSGRYDNK
jgi:hypothetical protein